MPREEDVQTPEDILRERMKSVAETLRPHGNSDPKARMAEIFQGSGLPDNLQKDLLLLQNETNWHRNFVLSDIFRKWYGQKLPDVTTKQDCTDMISATTDYNDPEMNQEVHFCAKLAMVSYALPRFIPYVSTKMHMSNLRFTRYIESMVAENTFPAFKDMDRVISGDLHTVTLPDNNQIAGFYIRTPVRVWNKSGKPTYKIPAWDKRDKLLERMVIGNVNVYVLRMNYKNGFDLHVLFRGTSNEFNGIPQYGKALQNTQVFRMPSYSVETQSFVPKGSTTKPLFYFYYCQMLEDVKPHVYACLQKLGVESEQCRRVRVCGHSMGGGMTTTFAYMSRLDRPEWWKKFYFRSYASPYSCNDAAVEKLESWVVESNQKYKFIEVVNTDDLVNIQYLFSSKEGMQESIKSGTASFAAWLVDQREVFNAKGNDMMEKAMRIMQLYPELALTTFINGAANAQSAMVPDNKRVAFRLGQRHSEIKHWGSAALNQTYNRSLNVIFCKRRIEWGNEGLGRSHTSYIGINMNLLWSPLRAWENKMYRYYSSHGIRENNQLRIVGLFPKCDIPESQSWLQEYNVPLWEPSRMLIQQTIRNQYHPATTRDGKKKTKPQTQANTLKHSRQTPKIFQ